MHNIKYWDVNTGAIKKAKHDWKDEIQFGDNLSNRSPASKYLMEVFTGSVDHVNRIPVIRGFAVRVTPIFTSKIHAINS
jgi:hypothetical protein